MNCRCPSKTQRPAIIRHLDDPRLTQSYPSHFASIVKTTILNTIFRETLDRFVSKRACEREWASCTAAPTDQIRRLAVEVSAHRKKADNLRFGDPDRNQVGRRSYC